MIARISVDKQTNRILVIVTLTGAKLHNLSKVVFTSGQFQSANDMGCVTRKGPLCPESFSYLKKVGRAGPCGPCFGMTPSI